MLDARDLANVGYPIVDVEADGTFTLTKPPATGGAVDPETVAEQLLYEVGDPAAYLTPDVVADFTSVNLKWTGPDAVRVEVDTRPAGHRHLQGSIAYRDGFAASGTLTILGPDAEKKAMLCGEIIRERSAPHQYVLRSIAMSKCSAPALWFRACWPSVRSRSKWSCGMTVRDSRRAVVERFAKEFAPLVTSGPPGVTGYTTGRPPVREVFAYWPAWSPRPWCRPK